MCARNEADERARHAFHLSPDLSVTRRGLAVVLHTQPTILGWISRLIWLRVRVALAVAVVVEDERAPTLRLLLVVGLIPTPDVEPAFHARRAGRRPQHVVVVHIHVTPAETGIDRR